MDPFRKTADTTHKDKVKHLIKTLLALLVAIYACVSVAPAQAQGGGQQLWFATSETDNIATPLETFNAPAADEAFTLYVVYHDVDTTSIGATGVEFNVHWNDNILEYVSAATTAGGAVQTPPTSGDGGQLVATPEADVPGGVNDGDADTRLNISYAGSADNNAPNRTSTGLTIKAPNAAPIISVDATPPTVAVNPSGDVSVDYAENGTDAVATFNASDESPAENIAWELGGADKDLFDIAGGVLTFNTPPDYENPTDTSVPPDNIYNLTITATATDDGRVSSSGTAETDNLRTSAPHAVTITVTNVNEKGTVTIAITRDSTPVTGAPRVGDTLTASVTDLDSPDGVTGEVTWQWTRRISGTTNTKVDIEGATAETYTVDGDDVGMNLQAFAEYRDGSSAAGNANDRQKISKATETVEAIAPDAPTGLTATADDMQVTLAWTAPESDGGADISGYEYRQSTTAGDYSVTGAVDWTAISSSDASTISHIADGLTNGDTYYFEVRAVNAAGAGAASDEISATPRTVPGRARQLDGGGGQDASYADLGSTERNRRRGHHRL